MQEGRGSWSRAGGRLHLVAGAGTLAARQGDGGVLMGIAQFGAAPGVAVRASCDARRVPARATFSHGSQRSPTGVMTSSWVMPRADCVARKRTALVTSSW